MGDLIRLSDRTNAWKQIFMHDGESVTLSVHRDEATGELDINITNDDGEAITVCLSRSDSADLARSVQPKAPEASHR